MKKLLTIFALMTFLSFFVTAQPQLTWQFANYEVINAGAQLQFDVEVKADVAGSYHRDLQVYFDYNTAGFGSDIVANGKVSVSNLTLMENHYSVVNLPGADNTSSKFAVITEADEEMDEPGSATYYNEITTTFQGLLRITIDIADNSENAGIVFDATLMSGGQYYQNTSSVDPEKYGANSFSNDLLTYRLSSIYGNITYANGASTNLSDITVELSGVVPVISDVTDTYGDYNLSSMADGGYTLDNTTTKAWGGLNGLDVILTKRFIGGLWSFTPLQLIASDVTESGAPGGLDIIMMKRRIGGLTTPAWTAPDYVFEVQNVNVTNGLGTKDYQSLCSGDVNGSYTPPAK